MAEWNLEWKMASEKLKEAQWEYRLAESALARATAKLNRAEAESNRLFEKRMHQVNQ